MNPAEPDPAAGGAPLDRVPAEVTQPAPEPPPAATETFPLPEPEQAPPGFGHAGDEPMTSSLIAVYLPPRWLGRSEW